MSSLLIIPILFTKTEINSSKDYNREGGSVKVGVVVLEEPLRRARLAHPRAIVELSPSFRSIYKSFIFVAGCGAVERVLCRVGEKKQTLAIEPRRDCADGEENEDDYSR